MNGPYKEAFIERLLHVQQQTGVKLCRFRFRPLHTHFWKFPFERVLQKVKLWYHKGHPLVNRKTRDNRMWTFAKFLETAGGNWRKQEENKKKTRESTHTRIPVGPALFAFFSVISIRSHDVISLSYHRKTTDLELNLRHKHPHFVIGFALSWTAE